ncbi:MAG: HYR domain-containing protein, partial [Bacteroidales bacterium]
MKKVISSRELMIILMMVTSLLLHGVVIAHTQDSVHDLRMFRDVKTWYTGWDNNPDSIEVYMDDSWDENDKDAIRVAMQRWNDAGCTPKFKEVSSSDDARVTVKKGTLPINEKGKCTTTRWASNKKIISAEIIIAENHHSEPHPLSLKEIVTHELGHALGLKDTDESTNPSDVMKGAGPTNGSDGTLSKHDSTEVKQAAGMITLTDEEPKEKLYAFFPDMAIEPGELSMLNFELPVFVSPDHVVTVEPLEDDDLFIDFINVTDNFLEVAIFSEPDHWSGTIILDIVIDEPMGDGFSYYGIHYINQFPTPNIDFECPFNIIEHDGEYIVEWMDLHNYPYPNPLRASLVINNEIIYTIRPTGDFTIDLPPGMNEIELLVDDYQVNHASFSMMYEVPEPQELSITCPPDVDTVNDPGFCYAEDVDPGLPDVDDPSDTYVLENDAPDSYPVGITEVTWTATNELEESASCVQLITIIDAEEPEIDNTEDIETPNDSGECGASVEWEPPPVEDNCGVESITGSHQPGDHFPVGETDVLYTATDVHGNTSHSGFRITIIDAEEPEIDNTEDIETPNDPGECGASVEWEPPPVEDNCGVESLTGSHQPGDHFPVGETDVLYTATDVHGNTSHSGFRITVIDAEEPEMDDTEDIETPNDPGECGASVEWEPPPVEDNCGVESITGSHQPGDHFPVGETDVLYTATDVHGNTSHSGFRITVIDVEPPEIDPQDDIVEEIEAGIEGAIITWDEPQITDNCGVESVTSNFASGDFFPTGETEVTYIATDIHGNESISTFNISVIEVDPPQELSITCPLEHWTVTTSDMVRATNRFFLAGINHMFFHGTCYSPDDAEWPGWLFYASTQVNNRNPLWREMPALFKYIGRSQSVLQKSTAENDVLVYWPYYDVAASKGRLFNHLGVNKDAGWFISHPINELSESLMGAGYTFDYISDKQLLNCEMINGKIVTGGDARYKAVVIPKTKYIPLETLQQLKQFVDEGGTVYFDEFLPESVPGIFNLEEREQQLEAAKAGFSEDAGNVVDLLNNSGITGEQSLAEKGFHFLKMKNENEDWYMVFNCSTAAFDEWVELQSPAQRYLLYFPENGEISAAESNSNSVRIQLEPEKAVFIRCMNKRVYAPSFTYFEPEQNSREIEGMWKISFVEGGPVYPGDIASDQLHSWTEMGDNETKRFAGTARYTIEFDWDKNQSSAFLNLGKVKDCARVKLNGEDAGTLLGPSYNVKVNNLQQGQNLLEVEVTNVAANRIRDLDKREVDWKKFHDINFVNIEYEPFDASGWEIKDAGLLGPV